MQGITSLKIQYEITWLQYFVDYLCIANLKFRHICGDWATELWPHCLKQIGHILYTKSVYTFQSIFF